MFRFYRDFEDVCNATREVERARTFAPELQTFAQWLAANAGRIPLE